MSFKICFYILFFFGLIHNINAEKISRKYWHPTWLKPAKTASEVGIKSYKESPMLSKLVKEGKLPSVAKRLPDDPIVSYPLKKIGKYGGSLVTFDGDVRTMHPIEGPLTVGPECSKILPNLAKKWKYTDGGKTLTIDLRKGLKWSDGHPFTADDFVFKFEKILMNSDLSPVVPLDWQGAKIEKIDDTTVRYHFKKPHPFCINKMAQSGDWFYAPAHFMKQYHPDFVPEEELEEKAKDAGYLGWLNLFSAVMREGGSDPFGRPQMQAFLLKKKNPTMWVFERNPYYFKVDPEGNQLPYIDTIESELTNNQEVIAAKASTGQVDYSGKDLNTQDIPLFKIGEKQGKIKALIWSRIHVDLCIQPNLMCEDLKLRKIFQDLRFRKAFSLGINRKELNEIVYFNRGTPRQTTVIPSSKFYEEEFDSKYLEFDPVEAGRLLDEMGLKDQDDDGFRDHPDGTPLNILLEWVKIETPKEITLELVREYMRAIGINLKTKEHSGSLQGNRARGNMMEMTIWHADRTTDILFPLQPFWWVPMHSGWEECHWVPWADWYRSNGEHGEKPPPDMMELINWYDEMRSTVDEKRQIELGKKILRSNMENIWTIGTIGLAPNPVVISNRLKNVTEKGYWGWDNRWTMPYHPETWYLEK
jgi:peptide/nickel transport system substrate-binding protein